VIVLQLFLFYVRLQAKAVNDRTTIQLSNPLASIVQQQTANNAMMKSLASSFLASSSSVMEYDLAQARNMQGGILFNLAFMWLLHFKMEQVQPLILQTANGLINLFYSPLFQAYVLGRNLQRPFATQAALMAEAQKEVEGEVAAETGGAESSESSPTTGANGMEEEGSEEDDGGDSDEDDEGEESGEVTDDESDDESDDEED
jgi:hypothetical protein